MAYEPQEWLDGQTVITAEKMEHIEQGIQATEQAIPTVPANVSAFNNDAGYLTQHQDISGKADKSYVDTELGKKQDKLTDSSTVTVNEIYAKETAQAKYLEVVAKATVNDLEVTDGGEVVTTNGGHYAVKTDNTDSADFIILENGEAIHKLSKKADQADVNKKQNKITADDNIQMHILWAHHLVKSKNVTATEDVSVGHTDESGSFVATHKLTEKANDSDLIELKMLGWNTPKECPIQNTVSGNQFIQRVGRVDLGSLSWSFFGVFVGHNMFYSDDLIGKIYLNENEVFIYSSKYTGVPNNKAGSMNNNEMRIRTSDGRLYINDDSVSNANAFKNNAQGVYLYYELANPITINIDGNEANTSNVFGTTDQWSSKPSWTAGETCIDDNKLWKCSISNSNKPSEGSEWTQISLKSLAQLKEKPKILLNKTQITKSGTAYTLTDNLARYKYIYIVVYGDNDNGSFCAHPILIEALKTTEILFYAYGGSSYNFLFHASWNNENSIIMNYSDIKGWSTAYCKIYGIV